MRNFDWVMKPIVLLIGPKEKQKRKTNNFMRLENYRVKVKILKFVLKTSWKTINKRLSGFLQIIKRTRETNPIYNENRLNFTSLTR